MQKISILGTDYDIYFKTEDEDKRLIDLDGYCDDSTKTIVILKPKEDLMNKGDILEFQKEIVRHEVIHAFLSESGLRHSSEWATNEEMVDYFAIQLPKIVGALVDFI